MHVAFAVQGGCGSMFLESCVEPAGLLEGSWTSQFLGLGAGVVVRLPFYAP